MIVEYPFESFPYSKTTWVLSIRQLSKSPDDSLVFSGQVSEHSQYMHQFDFDTVQNLIIGMGVSELLANGDHSGYLQKTIDNCNSVFPNLKNIYIFHTTVFFENLISTAKIIPICLPYFLLRSTLTDLSQFTEWNTGDKKAICLIGDIRNRVHKFPMLYYFYHNDSLDALNYALTKGDHGSDYFSYNNMNKVVQVLNDCFDAKLSLESMEQLHEKLSKVFEDDDDFKRKIFHGLNKYTHVYPKQWNNASCNLVLETTFYDMLHQFLPELIPKQFGQKSFFSEKIWKPILAGKPYIVISLNDMIYEDLEAMGFRTFLKYTSHPEKIYFDEPHLNFTKVLSEHFRICYNRTLSFLNDVEQNHEAILEDVKFNVQRWKELSQTAWDSVHEQCPPTRNMSAIDFCEIFNQPVDVFKCSNWINRE